MPEVLSWGLERSSFSEPHDLSGVFLTIVSHTSPRILELLLGSSFAPYLVTEAVGTNPHEMNCSIYAHSFLR